MSQEQLRILRNVLNCSKKEGEREREKETERDRERDLHGLQEKCWRGEFWTEKRLLGF